MEPFSILEVATVERMFRVGFTQVPKPGRGVSHCTFVF
jgi:hypothetical protein